VTELDLPAEIAAERQAFTEVLAALPGSAWDEPSLCAGWRVRDVVAHMTMPFRYSRMRFVSELLRDRGNFNRMADRCARRDAARLSSAELAAVHADNVENPWRPPGGGYDGALTHDVIHGLDCTTALGITREIPAARLRVVVDGLTTERARKHFGVDVAGRELHATDLDWSFGTGEPIPATGQQLVLLLGGRVVPGLRPLSRESAT
jgi:uncharacterized protein (TIGR03083 family)